MLYTSTWRDTLQLVLQARPTTSQEVAALTPCFVRQAALEAAAQASPDDDAAWRQVASCAFGVGDTDRLRPHAMRFMQSSEGDSVQQALARFLAALPRKPPAGKTASDHAVLLCLSALSALQLQQLALCEERLAAGRAVATLRLRAEVLVAATEALSAAAQHCSAVLTSDTPLGAGPLQLVQYQSVWQDAIEAWHAAHIGTCQCWQ